MNCHVKKAGRRAAENSAARRREKCYLLPTPLPDRTGMSSRMCDSGSSPLAWVEFSTHCWFCGADRTGTSWTAIGTTPTSEPTLAFAGRPTQGLFSEPWMSAICGLMSPVVAELPNDCVAPTPLLDVVPPSFPVASACGAAAAEAPTAQTA